MPPKQHSRLGASGSKRWMNCTGSVQMSEGQPNDPNQYSAEGSVAHEVAEKTLRLNLSLGPESDWYIKAEEVVAPGTVIEHDGFDVEVTETMCEAVDLFVGEVCKRVVRGDTVFIEHQFDLGPLNPPEPMFGTTDVAIWRPRTRLLRVIDFKNGYIEVDPHENDQLLYYALGSVLALGDPVPERIELTIVQPRTSPPVRSFTTDFKRLVEWKKQLFAAAHATQEPGAPLNVGEWCRFCPALAVCPAQQKRALEVARAEFGALPDPVHLRDDDLLRVLPHVEQMVDWLRAVQARATSRLEAGVELPGYKLIASRTHRKWADEKAAETYLRGKRLPVASRYKPRQLVSPAQAEKALKRLGAELPERLVFKPEGRPKLAPASHSAPALAPAVVTEFGSPPDSE